MTGTKQSGSKGAMRIGSISLVLTGIALATTVAPLTAFAAGSKPLPIEKIGIDNARQLVVQFATEPGAFPSIPNVLDLPGPNHRVVVDFADTTIDRAKIPTVEEMKTAMTKVLPVVNGIRYTTLPNAAKPTARIVLELPEDLKVTPRVVKVEETSVTINLGEEVKNLVVPKKTTAKPNQTSAKPATVPTPGGDTTVSAMTQPSAPRAQRSAPVPQGAPAYTEPLEPENAPVASAPVASAPVASAPIASAPVAEPVAQAPVAFATPATTVTTTHYDTVAPVVPAGQPVVSADGETVALKGEQKLDPPSTPAGATKGGTTAAGWDWNSPVENELVSKAAETKTMGEGAVAPVPEAKSDAEEALIKKVAAKELGLAEPAATATAPAAPVDAAAAPIDATPVAAVKKAINTAPVAQLRDIDTAPVPVTEAAPSAVTEMAPEESKSVAKIAQAAPVEAPTPTETNPLTLPTEAPKTAAPAADEGAAPQPEPAGPAQSLKLYNSAVRNHLSGKLMEAINDYKGALAANPLLAEAHSNLGLIYNQQHNYAGALGEFHKALAINPKDAITYNGIGAALRAEKDLPGAIKNWQTAVDIDPKLATAHYNLGTAFEIQKDYDRALDAYRDAVTNDYRLGEAYYRMGLILQQKHLLEDAATQYKEALKVNATSEYSADAKARLAALQSQKK